MTWTETVPARNRYFAETKQPTLSSVGRLPVPVDLEEKTETLTTEKQDRQKRPAPERETVQRIPVEITPSKSEEPPAFRDDTYNEPSSDMSNCWMERKLRSC